MPKGDRGEAIGYFGFATFKLRHYPWRPLLLVDIVYQFA
jgi:hypothetical protein